MEEENAYMSYKIVFFDIDGTLVNEEKVVPQDTIEAIREIKALGVEPVIATGRAPYFFEELLEQVGISSYVSLNGALAVYQGEVIYRRPIAPEIVESFVNFARQQGHPLCFEGESRYATDNLANERVQRSLTSLKVKLPVEEHDFWSKEDIYQMFLHAIDGEDVAYKHFEDRLTFIRWHADAIDILPLGGSKAKGIEAMLTKLGIDRSEAVAFGDNLNDKEMLEYVGLGIAMGNSHPDVIPYANYVTTHVDEQGIRNGLIAAGILKSK